MRPTPFPLDFSPPSDGDQPRQEVAELLILTDAGYYGDGPPQWLEGRSQRPCQTGAEARADRLRQVKRLRRFGRFDPRAEAVADRLEGCEPNRRCQSGACPECARAWQRWFTAATNDFLAHTTVAGSRGTIVSPVHRAGIVSSRRLCP